MVSVTSIFEFEETELIELKNLPILSLGDFFFGDINLVEFGLSRQDNNLLCKLQMDSLGNDTNMK